MTPARPALPRRAALLALPALLAACGTTRVAPLGAPPRGRVVVLRGLLNVFSTGMNVLTATLRQAGYDATVHNHVEWRRLAAEAAEAQGTGALKRPLAVIGHSFGADDAILLAGRLGARGVPVDLLITFDPAWVLNVPRGPRRVVNFHQDRDAYPRRLAPGPGFDGRIENRQVTDESHLSIDKDLRLHIEVQALLAETPGPGAATAAAPAPPPARPIAAPPARLPRPPVPPVRAGR
jgi:hypothetical protein